MFRLLLPTGMAALLLSTLALAAQVREDPRNTTPTPVPGKRISPDQLPGKRISPDQPAVRPNRPVGDKGLPRGGQPAAKRKQSRVYLGVYTVPVEDMSNRERRKMKLKDTEGVLVVEVMPDSPAETAGLLHGDVILRVNGKETDDEEELSKDLNQLGPGKPVKLSILREGKRQEITATLQESPAGAENEELTGLCHENTERIERLEQKIARLEKRLRDMEKARSAKNAQ